MRHLTHTLSLCFGLIASMLLFTACPPAIPDRLTTEDQVIVQIYSNGGARLELNIMLPDAKSQKRLTEDNLGNSLAQSIAADPAWNILGCFKDSKNVVPLPTDVSELRGEKYDYLCSVFLRADRTVSTLDDLKDATPFAIGGQKVSCTYATDSTACYAICSLQGADHLFAEPLSKYVSQKDFDLWIKDKYRALELYPGEYADSTTQTYRLDDIDARIADWENASRQTTAAAGKPYPFSLHQLIEADTHIGHRLRAFDEETAESFFHAVHLTFVQHGDTHYYRGNNYTIRTVELSVADLIWNGGSYTFTASYYRDGTEHSYGIAEVKAEEPKTSTFEAFIDTAGPILGIIAFMSVVVIPVVAMPVVIIIIIIGVIRRRQGKNTDTQPTQQLYRQGLTPEEQQRWQARQLWIEAQQEKRRIKNDALYTAFIDVSVIYLLTMVAIFVKVPNDFPFFFFPLIATIYLTLKSLCGKRQGLGSLLIKTRIINTKTGKPASRLRSLARGLIIALFVWSCIIFIIDIIMRFCGSCSIADLICSTNIVPDDYVAEEYEDLEQTPDETPAAHETDE